MPCPSKNFWAKSQIQPNPK